MTKWEDEQLPLVERVQALIEGARGRSKAKSLGAWLDLPGQRALKAELIRLAEGRGLSTIELDESWAGKRLLRLSQGREQAARVRRNPIVRDENFECVQCKQSVLAHGRTARDHCPNCLCSLHVDCVPGDRAETCLGVLRPVGIELRSGHPFVLYRCDRCAERRVNRALLDGEHPDNWTLITELSALE